MRRATRSLAALSLASALALAACGSGDIIVQSGSQSGSQSGQPNLDRNRIDSVLSSIQETLTSADSLMDGNALSPRLTDPALVMRTSQYTLAQATGAPPPALSLTSQAVAVTDSGRWPRAIVDIGQSSDGTRPPVFIVVQDSPRSDYMLQSWTRLLGSTSLTFPSVLEGSPYLGADSTGFTKTPREAISAYVDMLNKGEAGNDSFTVDEFATTYLSDVSALATSVQAAGTVTAQAADSTFPISGVVLHDGSALVSGTFTFTHTYQRTVANSTMRLGGAPAQMNEGDDSVIGTLTVSFVASVLIQIPTADAGGKATLVGAERIIQSTSRDDSVKPAGE